MISKVDLDMIGEAALRYGLKYFEFGSMKLHFGAAQQPQLATSTLQNQPIGETHGMPTDDQLLFASSIPLSDDEIAARAP